MDDNDIKTTSVDKKDPADPGDSKAAENEQLLNANSRLAYVKLCAILLRELYPDDLWVIKASTINSNSY